MLHTPHQKKEWCQAYYKFECVPQLSITEKVKSHYTLYLTHNTTLRMKKSERSTSAINPVTAENVDTSDYALRSLP